MENKQTKVVSTLGRVAGKQNLGKNIEKTISAMFTKTARMLNYGDELNYEDREPGFILDETKR